jgi:hypothetical protein
LRNLAIALTHRLDAAGSTAAAQAGACAGEFAFSSEAGGHCGAGWLIAEDIPDPGQMTLSESA